MGALENFIDIAIEEFINTTQTLDKSSLEAAAELIFKAKQEKNRLHVTGIGKPSHVASYISSLLSSTGTPAYFLDGTEAVHGSSGQLVEGDVVIAISNSGETPELKVTITAIKSNGCKIVGVTGNRNSYLAKNSDVCLLAKVSREGDDLNRPPRTSVIAEIFVLQCLSIILQEKAGLTVDKYIKTHPGGALGRPDGANK